MTEWHMFAGRTDHPTIGVIYQNPAPDRRYAEHHGHKTIVEVIVTEDSEGPYYGWLRTGTDTPVMIQPHAAPYLVQFPYGPDAGERAGKGRTVRLRIEEAL